MDTFQSSLKTITEQKNVRNELLFPSAKLAIRSTLKEATTD
jgi:hypothetical protein